MSDIKFYLREISNDSQKVPGKPYPEDFGTSIANVYAFIHKDEEERERKPTLWLQIVSGILGAIILGLAFDAFYHETQITIMFGVLGAFIGVIGFNALFRKIQTNKRNSLMANTPEGVYISALKIWAAKKEKEDLTAAQAYWKDLEDNPWIITERSLFPEDPLFPTEGSIEPILDENGEIIDYQFDYLVTERHMTFPIWYFEKNPTGINMTYIVQHSIEEKGKYVDINKAICLTAHRKKDGKDVQFLKWDKGVLYKGKRNRP